MNAIDVADQEGVVARALAGEAAAFAELVRRHPGLVFAVCFEQTGSLADSEEVTQEVFLAASRGLAGLKEWEKCAAWLQGIARNLSRMQRRRRGVQPLRAGDLDGLTADGDGTMRALELQHLLHEALLGVTGRSREVLTLHYLGGYSNREIGALCSLPLRTVRSWLHEGRAQLKARLLRMVAELCRCARSGEHAAQCTRERCGQCGQAPCACVARPTAD